MWFSSVDLALPAAQSMPAQPLETYFFAPTTQMLGHEFQGVCELGQARDFALMRKF